MCCLDCSVSLLLFSNIWKFIYLAELSIQKNLKQTNKQKKKTKNNKKQSKKTTLSSGRQNFIVFFCVCLLPGKRKNKEIGWRAEDPESWELWVQIGHRLPAPKRLNVVLKAKASCGWACGWKGTLANLRVLFVYLFMKESMLWIDIPSFCLQLFFFYFQCTLSFG